MKNKILSELILEKKGKILASKNIIKGPYPVIGGGQKPTSFHNEFNAENCITISSSGSYAGFVNFYKEKVFLTDCFSVYPKNEEELNLNFLFYVLQNYQSVIYSRKVGGAIPHFYFKDLKGLTIPDLSIEEQKKIAEILTCVDGNIKIIDNKICKYETLFEGLLSNINKECKVIRKKIEKIADVSGGKRIPKGMTFSSGITKNKYLRVADLKEKYIDKKALKYVSDEVFKFTGKNLLNKNDLYISVAGTLGTVGIVDEDTSYSFTENINKIKAKPELDPLFLMYYLNTERIRNEIRRYSVGGGVPKLPMHVIKNLEVEYPENINIQKKIVEKVSCLRFLIEKEKEKNKKLNQLKKSLMQDLLTGKKRVKLDE